MAPAPDSHLPLWLAAAVASGWPVLRARGSQAAVEGVLARIEAAVGPLPQAILDEPWDEGDWALEVALPGWSAEDCAVLAEVAGEGCWYTPGPRPDVAEAIEQGLREDAYEAFGAVVARRPLGSALPTVSRTSRVDPELLALEAELVAALRQVEPTLQTWSDRGPDTVAAVVDPSTGRFGVMVSLLSEVFAPLDGLEVASLRRRILAALADSVLARADHPALRLAPDPWWWTPLDGMDVALWAIGPALPVWAFDLDHDVTPDAAGRAALARSGDPLRVLVVPASPADFERVCFEGAAVAEAVGAGGGPGEWVRSGGRWCFVPSWSVDEPDRLEEVVAAFAALGPVGVAAVG